MKLICPSEDRATPSEDVRQFFFLYQHLHLSPGITPDWNIHNYMGEPSPLPLADRITDLIESAIKSSVQVFKAVSKACQRLAKIEQQLLQCDPGSFLLKLWVTTQFVPGLHGLSYDTRLDCWMPFRWNVNAYSWI